MTFRPKLRQGIKIELADDGEIYTLKDRLVGLRIGLNPASLRITRRLDGSRDIEQICADDPPLPRLQVEDVVRRYLLLNLLEGAGTDIVARLRRYRDDALPLPISILKEGRFACQGSGECCRGYNFGPLRPEDVARIEALDVRSALPHLREAHFFNQTPAESGERQFYLAVHNEQCIFLLDDARCGLHVHFGAEAKPALCRKFPYTVQATVAGIKIWDNGECARFSTSARTGTPIMEDLERLGSLLDLSRGLDHPSVFLQPGMPIDFGHFLQLQKAAVSLLASHQGGAEQMLQAVGRQLGRFIDELSVCGLAVGEPDATVERVLATPDEPAAPPTEATVQAGGLACAELCAALVQELVRGAHGVAAPSKERIALRQIGELIPMLHVVQAVASALHAPERFPLGDYFCQVADLPASDPELDEVLRISFRQALFGYRALAGLRPRAGLLRLVLTFLVALHGGRLRALAEGRPEVSAEHLDPGHMVAHRLFRRRSMEAIFYEHEDKLWDVLAALPALAGRGSLPPVPSNHADEA